MRGGAIGSFCLEVFDASGSRQERLALAVVERDAQRLQPLVLVVVEGEGINTLHLSHSLVFVTSSSRSPLTLILFSNVFPQDGQCPTKMVISETMKRLFEPKPLECRKFSPLQCFPFFSRNLLGFESRLTTIALPTNG